MIQLLKGSYKKRMNFARRTAAVILSLVMVLTMIPVFSFAGDESDAPEETQIDVMTYTEEAAAEDAADETSEAIEDMTEDPSAVPAEEPEVLPEETAEDEHEDPDVEAFDYDEEDDEEYDESDMGYGEESFSSGIDPEAAADADPGEMLEEFFYGDSDADGKEKTAGTTSIKGSRLTGNNLFYYNNLKSLMKEVAAAKRSSTVKNVPISKIHGKRKFTAKDLGVSKIGYKKNGKWYLTAKAKKKIQALFVPSDWDRVCGCLEVDMPAAGYWINWSSKHNTYNVRYHYRYNAKTVTFYASDKVTFSIPVAPEFAKAADAYHNYVYKADTSKIRGTNTAKSKARSIVKTFDDAIPTTFAGYSNEAIDYYRLWWYCDMVDYLTEYDHDAAELKESAYWKSPWTMISVFDEDESTKAVCEGYAKAFKYLCDISTFRSNWIDCQLVTSKTHMWNIVRMNDGLNYVVDPTWTDDGYEADVSDWFLRGAPYGNANGYTIAGSKRVYDAYTKKLYAPAERTLSKKDRYEWVSSKPIKLKKTSVKKLVPGKKSFTVKWKKMVTPLGALYIDGYQIQYGLKKNFKGARKVTVKGYAKASKKIKKLKRRKYYYVRVRTFAKVGKKTYYSAWSPAKRVKTK